MANKKFESEIPSGDALPGTPITIPAELRETLEQYADNTAKLLASRPKVKIRIALPPGVSKAEAAKMERPPAVPVCINGYTYLIRRGDWVEIPDVVANVLAEANYI